MYVVCVEVSKAVVSTMYDNVHAISITAKIYVNTYTKSDAIVDRFISAQRSSTNRGKERESLYRANLCSRNHSVGFHTLSLG